MAIDIESLRDADRNATPGPWSWHSFGNAGDEAPTSTLIHTGEFDWIDLAYPGSKTLIAALEAEGYENADLIVELRNALPEIIERLDRLAELENQASAIKTQSNLTLDELTALRATLEFYNYGPDEIASDLGLKNKTVADAIEGRRPASSFLLAGIADHLDFSVDYLLGRTEEKPAIDICGLPDII